MTDTEHLHDDDLVLRYYGELDADREARAAAHVATCAACRAGEMRLRQVLSAVDALPEPALPDGFERTVWARLQPALETPRGSWFSWMLSPARLAWLTAVVLLVGASFMAGRLSGPAAPRDEAAAGVAAGDHRERVLLTDLTDHLERSQTMLVELVNAEAEGTVDVTLERERAGNLVASNRLYRQSASAAGDSALTELLDDLERVLIELAASPDELSAADLDQVRSRIAARDLLFKVRVVSNAVRERQKADIRARTGQSS